MCFARAGWRFLQRSSIKLMLATFFSGSGFSWIFYSQCHSMSIIITYYNLKWQETLLTIGPWIQPQPARSAVDPPLILTMTRSSMLPVALLALAAWILSSLTSQSGFVMNSATPRGSKVAMRGFKDDFYAWKETLSSEDQALLLKQAQNASWLKRLGSLCDGAAAITFSSHWYTYSNYQNCACIGGWEVSF